ncbi:MAG: hypothetical protein R3245_11430 [Kiloniellales bacterium]|nr:hypothetical protein [Kiloniellales bacterium]
MSISIVNESANAPDPSAPRVSATELLHARTLERLKSVIGTQIDACSHILPHGAQARALAALQDFEAMYDGRPVRENSGGSGFNDSLWLYVMARAFAPSTIIESGVHKGHSTWIFRKACPDAEIYSFDITFAKRIYHDSGTHYAEADWSTWSIPDSVDPETTLILFDDHISHAQRLLEAYDLRFQHLLLDDNFSAEHLYATGGPPAPTLAMLQDPQILDLDAVSWRRNGKFYSYDVQKEEIKKAREVIDQAWVLPELGEVTRHPLGSRLSLVKLS